MIQECTSSYRVDEHKDGSATIHIEVPERFRDLWITRLSGLQTTEEEISDFETND